MLLRQQCCCDSNAAALCDDPPSPRLRPLRLSLPPLQAHANLANALQQLGSLDLALMYYQSALRLRPAFTDAINNMATAFLQKGLVLQVRGAGAGWGEGGQDGVAWCWV